jgi:hypothetical protein
MAILREPSDSGPWTDGYNSAYDTVTDRVWDNINKGVCFSGVNVGNVD